MVLDANERRKLTLLTERWIGNVYKFTFASHYIFIHLLYTATSMPHLNWDSFPSSSPLLLLLPLLPRKARCCVCCESLFSPLVIIIHFSPGQNIEFFFHYSLRHVHVRGERSFCAWRRQSNNEDNNQQQKMKPKAAVVVVVITTWGGGRNATYSSFHCTRKT